MKYRAVTGKVRISFLLAMLILVSSVQLVVAQPGTWSVDDDGSADFSSIQDAINAASYGDTIFVGSGTYYENVVVKKTVSLVGENRETTIIYGNGEQTVDIDNRKVKVKGFTIQDGFYGVRLGENAYSSTIEDNEVRNNRVGILIETGNSLVTRNIIVNNSRSSIEVWAPCGCLPLRGNIVMENTILNNNQGIDLQDSAQALVYHNNFINNTAQVVVSYSNTTWDNGYPSGGNYWSSHNSTDLYCGPNQNRTGSDGIGDRSYTIVGNNIDRYPLLYPYGYACGPDVNGDDTVDIYDVVTVSVGFGSQRGNLNWNQAADLNYDGVVDIYDVVKVATNFGKTV